MLQRVKEVQESDLRMDGALARNIQRVIAVTQADIDAAAAQGKAWLVKPVVKVSDPLDNLRGGTQLVIKQNSILPGQNVMRVMYIGGQAVVVGPGTSPLSLPDATDNDILSLIAFGGTEQTDAQLPRDYVRLSFVYMLGDSYVLSNLVPTPDCKIEMDFQTLTIASGARTYLGCRDTSGSNDGLRVAHISSGIFRIYGFGTYADSATAVQANTRYKFVWNNKQATITTGGTTVFDNTFAAEGTNQTAVAINGWNTAGTVDVNTEGMYFYSLKMWDNQGNLIAHYIPALHSGAVCLYDTVSGQEILPTTGTFAGGPAWTPAPTPTEPIPLVSNNGVLKVRHQSGLPLGYTRLDYLQSDGASYLVVPYIVNNKTVFYARYNEIQNGPQTANAIFGVTDSPDVSRANNGILRLTGVSFNRMGWGDSTTGSIINTESAPKVFDTWYEVLYDQNKLYQDGTLYATSATDPNTVWSANYGLGIFARNSSSVTMFAVVKISSVWAKENSEYKINLVPAKRNSDNVLGMYDLVSGQFFTNQGTGDFVAGNTVSDPVEIYTDGLQETIAIKDDQSATVSTAVAEMLLKIDSTYTDQQEIIDGTVTRKIGIKVLDGTEDGWSKTNNSFGNTALFADKKREKSTLFCSHFQYNDGSTTAILNGCVGCASTSTNTYFRDDDLSTVEDWQQ